MSEGRQASRELLSQEHMKTVFDVIRKKNILFFFADLVEKYAPNEAMLNQMADRPRATPHEETLSNFCVRQLFEYQQKMTNLESKVRKYLKVFPRFHVYCSIDISPNTRCLSSS